MEFKLRLKEGMFDFKFDSNSQKRIVFFFILVNENQYLMLYFIYNCINHYDRSILLRDFLSTNSK